MISNFVQLSVHPTSFSFGPLSFYFQLVISTKRGALICWQDPRVTDGLHAGS